MNQDTREIDKIIFGVLSQKQIMDMSIGEINNPKLVGIEKSENLSGTVYDPKMGTIVNGKNCETCNQNVWDCPGHFGHITLNEPIVHPLYHKNVINFLSCFCIRCHRLLITEDQLRLNNIVKRFEKILDKLEKIDTCSHCSNPQPEFRYSTTDTNVYMKYKQKEKNSVIISVEEIINIFDDITNHDVKLLGFDPDLVHPRNFILSLFVVLPQCFVENTLVLTDNGYKFIQDVDKTDMLYTHMGRFRPIKEVFINNYTNNKIIHINTAYHFNTIKCTSEHPFFVKDGDGSMWLEAEDLTTDHYIGMKRNTNNVIPKFIFSINGEEVLNWFDNLNEWFLTGYFVSNGWIDYSIQGIFFLYVNEDSINDIISVLNVLGIEYNIMSVENKVIKCYDLILWDIFHDFRDANNEMPMWVHDAPPEFLENFFKGYKLSESFHKREEIQYLLSMQMLYLKFGVVINKNEEIIDTDNNEFVLIEEEYVWFKITDISEKQVLNTIKVYNFEVEEDNSYVVENLIGHNCCRPYVITDGNMCDDDLTLQLIEIIKTNNNLNKDANPQLTETQRQKYLQTLKFRIFTFYNNSGGRAKHTTNGRPIKGIKERLTGKGGLIRMNLMGKRRDQTGRTVIGPDPTLKMGQLAVPQEMADNLTVPVQVTKFNFDYLTELVRANKANFVLKKGGVKINLQNALYSKGTRLNHGDIIIRDGKEIVVNNGKDVIMEGDRVRRNGKMLENIIYPHVKEYKLYIGDIVERKLQDGDIVLLNRQPTKPCVKVETGDCL